MKKLSIIDPRGYRYRDMWPLGDRICVRPGLRTVIDLGITVAACKSVRVPTTGETWHYVVSSTGAVYIYDDNLSQIASVSGPSANVRSVSFAVQADQIIITSPDFQTMNGLLGSGVEVMRRKSSINPATTAISPPGGVCVAIANRVAIADGSWVYLSDPNEPRTFVPQNISRIPSGAPIYGLHVGNDGALIACTATGVWALPEDALSVGQRAAQVWSKLTDHVILDYDSTAMVQGRLYALTRHGVRTLWPEGPEIDINDRVGGLDPWSSADDHFDDLRFARLLPSQDGPMVSISNRLWRHHVSLGFSSWWRVQDGVGYDIVGTLESGRGEELLVAASGEVFRLIGGVDGAAAFGDGSALFDIYGQVVAQFDPPVDARATLREVHWRTAGHSCGGSATGGSMSVAGGLDEYPETYLKIDGAVAWTDATTYASPEPVYHRAQLAAAIGSGFIRIHQKGGRREFVPAIATSAVIHEGRPT